MVLALSTESLQRTRAASYVTLVEQEPASLLFGLEDQRVCSLQFVFETFNFCQVILSFILSCFGVTQVML